MDARPTLFLTVGLPGVGKTTRAKELAATHRILRLTPDDWMAPLFGRSDVDGRRDVLEGRMIWVAHQVLLGGSSVVLDFGCWSADERYAIRVIAETAGARFVLELVQAAEDERRRRASARWREAPETTFEMTEADHDRFLAAIELPSDAELSYGPVPPPPAGHDTWPEWASTRWPTLPVITPPNGA
ncbi:AAA family ATPase [Phycicoccus sonneratiae]|uniref:AAA family ATPase n=1 Tax=Phycicoccus sonneratiae TaxID=2807628 RepID=A0ABS2CI66_9MICO|nr:AAA family ATPase [Phycicoccus sonneraticus]MBM6399559.1 AAA family ATPase [Phycicoccus sonneraticus]